METSFEKFILQLHDAKIRFIVAGGFAVAMNGFTRVTEDIDLLLDSDSSNLQSVIHFLESYGEGNAKGLTIDELQDESPGCIRIIEDFPIDLFTRLGGKTYLDWLPQTKLVSVESRAIQVLNREALIELKKGSFREKDQIDVLTLQRLIQEGKSTS
jgi:hypothetical protein